MSVLDEKHEIAVLDAARIDGEPVEPFNVLLRYAVTEGGERGGRRGEAAEGAEAAEGVGVREEDWQLVLLACSRVLLESDSVAYYLHS